MVSSHVQVGSMQYSYLQLQEQIDQFARLTECELLNMYTAQRKLLLTYLPRQRPHSKDHHTLLDKSSDRC